MNTMNVGKYQLLDEIGRGGFATVYRAIDTELRRKIALKVLKPAWLDDREAVARFYREARAAADLVHPNIVVIHDIGNSDGRLYIDMQLIEGKPLNEYVLENGPMNLEKAGSILADVSSALAYAHGKGYIHRDIKPGNILIRDDGRAVVTDFGLVRGAELASMASMNSSGAMMGTPEYVAPEIWHGLPATAASDMYALGCVASEMLTGKILFSASSPMAVMGKHAEGWQTAVTDSADLPEIVSALLNRDPAQRLSAEAFQARLVGASIADREHIPPADVTGGSASVPITPRNSRLLKIVAAVGAAGILSAILGVLVIRALANDVNVTLANAANATRTAVVASTGYAISAKTQTVEALLAEFDRATAVAQRVGAEQAATAAVRAASTAEAAAKSTALAEANSNATSEAYRSATATAIVDSSNKQFADKARAAIVFGRDGWTDSCGVVRKTTTATQRDIVEERYFYFAFPFSDIDVGRTVTWSLSNANGPALQSQSQKLDADMKGCFKEGFDVAWDAPGKFVFDIGVGKYSIAVVPLTVSVSTLPPRPARQPFGRVTFGVDGISKAKCEAGGESARIPADERYFYFASGYVQSEIGRRLRYSILAPDGSLAVSDTRILENEFDLCFWQGVSTGFLSAGVNTLVVEWDDGTVIFRRSFETLGSATPTPTSTGRP